MLQLTSNYLAVLQFTCSYLAVLQLNCSYLVVLQLNYNCLAVLQLNYSYLDVLIYNAAAYLWLSCSLERSMLQCRNLLMFILHEVAKACSNKNTKFP